MKTIALLALALILAACGGGGSDSTAVNNDTQAPDRSASIGAELGQDKPDQVADQEPARLPTLGAFTAGVPQTLGQTRMACYNDSPQRRELTLLTESAMMQIQNGTIIVSDPADPELVPFQRPNTADTFNLHGGTIVSNSGANNITVIWSNSVNHATGNNRQVWTIHYETSTGNLISVSQNNVFDYPDYYECRPIAAWGQ